MLCIHRWVLQQMTGNIKKLCIKGWTSTFIWKNIRLRFCLPEKSNAEIAWYFVYTTCWCLTQGPSNAPANHPTRYHREDTVWLGLTHLLPVCGKKLQSKSCANNLHAEIYRKSWHFFNWGIYIYIILGVVSGDFCFSCFSATFNH